MKTSKTKSGSASSGIFSLFVASPLFALMFHGLFSTYTILSFVIFLLCSFRWISFPVCRVIHRGMVDDTKQIRKCSNLPCNSHRGMVDNTKQIRKCSNLSCNSYRGMVNDTKQIRKCSNLYHVFHRGMETRWLVFQFCLQLFAHGPRLQNRMGDPLVWGSLRLAPITTN